jgi:ribosomal protein S18 acetylase RimI-like enzyme
VLRIRNAELADLDALTGVFTTCFNQPPWSDGWSEDAARERLGDFLSTRHGIGAVAELDSKPVGFLLGQKERWVSAYHFNLVELCVLPDQQRHGIGRALLQHLIDRLRGEGCERVFLITASNSPAAAFYEAFGFYTSSNRVMMGYAIPR